MASIKNLKKDINYILGDIIEECYVWQSLNPKADSTKSEAVIDESIEAFDSLINMINAKDVENKKVHFRSIEVSLETKAIELIKKVNEL